MKRMQLMQVEGFAGDSVVLPHGSGQATQAAATAAAQSVRKLCGCHAGEL